MKKLFIFSVAVLSLLLILFGVYNFVLKKDSSTNKIFSGKSSENIKNKEKINKETQQDSMKTIASLGKIKKIADGDVFFPTVDESDKKIKYYSKENGGFWELSFDGSLRKKVANENFSKLSSVIWSPDKKNIILKMNGDFYNYKYSEIPKKIKNNIKYLVWSNLGDKIIYDYANTEIGGGEINIADKDGSNWKRLADIENNKYIISTIPQTSLIAFWNNPDAYTKINLKTISISGGNTDSILVDRFGADFLVSQNGERYLVSSILTKGGNNMALEIGNFNKGNENLINLNFPTLVSKCVWAKDNKTIYCTLPSGIPDSAVMPNDYQEKKFYTIDSFWKIDTESGEKDRIVEMDDITEKIDATNLFLSPNEDILFFVNRRDGSLYRITL